MFATDNLGSFLVIGAVVCAAASGPLYAKKVTIPIPVTIEENIGQADPEVKFIARGGGYTVELAATSMLLSVSDSRLRTDLVGASQSATLVGESPKAARSHYLLGNNPAAWRTDVPHYGAVRGENIYPGVDIVYYADHGRLEYDFIVARGADPSSISLAFDCATPRIDRNGDLLLRVGRNTIGLSRPVAYQHRGQRREMVTANYLVDVDGRVRFQIGDYDHSRQLIVDPAVVLASSTYLGGLGTDVGNGIAVDPEGNTYVIGRTESDNFPVAAAMQPVRRGGRDIFVAKFDDEGADLLYATYIGGSADENPLEIAVDANGNAFITGVTSSIDFPTVNPFQPSYGGGGQDAFVLKLDAAGANLIYSTYLGGTGLNQSRGIAVDAEGHAYIAGNTPADGFPTRNPLQSYGGGVSDGFITKLSRDGARLVYSTFLGGSGLESCRGIRLDAEGNAYVVGETRSTNFPVTSGAFQTSYGGGLDDLFVAKVNAAGTALVYATYLGGNGTDQGQSTIGTSSTIHGRIIAIDLEGNAYVTGDTASANFPVKNAFQPSLAGGTDAFVAKLTPNGSDLFWSTYLGGAGFDTARSITVDAYGRAVVAGATSSLDFPIVSPVQATYGGGDFDAFVTAFNRDGTALRFSTYLGGDSTDVAWDITCKRGGKHLYVTGQTSSADFPMNEAIQSSPAGGFDAFVARLVITGHARREP